MAKPGRPKGRYSNFTDRQVSEMCRLFGLGWSAKELARRFSTSRQVIDMFVKRQKPRR